MQKNKKKRFSKKANVHYYLLLALAIPILIFFTFMTLQNKPKQFAEKIGELQVALLNTYNKAEKILFYVDQSARYSSYKAVKFLADNAGVQKDDCGEYLGYKILNADGETCIKSSDVKAGYEFYFAEELSKYFNAYPDENIAIDLYEDFIVKEEGNKITIYGPAIKDITIDIWNRNGQALEEKYQQSLAQSMGDDEIQENEIQENLEKYEEDNSDNTGDIQSTVNVPLKIPGIDFSITPDSVDKASIDIKGCPPVPPVGNFVKDTQCLSSSCYIRAETKSRLDAARANAVGIGGKIILTSGWRNNCKKGGRHSTGGAVDVRLMGKNLNCGCMGESRYSRNPCNPLTSGLYAYRDSKTSEGKKIHECRMKVKEYMESAGFINPAEFENWRKMKEWWHWEYGTKSWAVASAQGIKYQIIA